MISQALIAIFGLSSIFLISTADKGKMKYGFMCGLAAEPFWLYSSITNEQWGITVLVIFYTYAHLRGLLNCLRIEEKPYGHL